MGDGEELRQVLRYDSGARGFKKAAIFLGVLAGANSLAAYVALYDQGSNQLIAKFDVTGASASHPLSSENDLEDAIREAVTQIMLALR